MKSDLESAKVILELRDQNQNFRNLLQRIDIFRDSSNIDKLFLSDDFKLLDQDYRMLVRFFLIH